MDYLSLCLICKNEAGYLAEWLDYHIVMGVDRFYIYDNDSQPDLSTILRDYIEHGWVVLTRITGKAMQMHAYAHCLQTFGPHTRWLGFIDTDEFLVTKSGQDLREFLQGYEPHAGLAVSSLFFGSNGQDTPPATGQMAGYTLRTPAFFQENSLIKSIVQPANTLAPNSPHDFIYNENQGCVDEGGLRVEDQRSPNHIAKIQLNHYFCRSQADIQAKLSRGRGDSSTPWQRTRFDRVNQLSTEPDTTILQNLASRFAAAGIMAEPAAVDWLEKLSALAQKRAAAPLPPFQDDHHPLRPQFIHLYETNRLRQSALDRGESGEVKRLLLILLQAFPQKIPFYVDLAVCLLSLKEPEAAWQALARAWQLAPNNYTVLNGMAHYFLLTGKFSMAENASRLLLQMAPGDLIAQGYLAEALLELGQIDEALQNGVSAIENAGLLGELPKGMGPYLIKKMADVFMERKDLAAAGQLWQAGIRLQPEEVGPRIEWIKILLLQGEHNKARGALNEVQQMAPRHPALSGLRQQLGKTRHTKHSR